MALGARRIDILRLVVREGIGALLLGLISGVGVAIALSRYIATLLYGVTPTDTTTFVVTTAMIGFAGLIAGYMLPSCKKRRACRSGDLSEIRISHSTPKMQGLTSRNFCFHCDESFR
jgi:hypothetical protein